MEIKLSYILTTYNKLSYLKITLPYLIAACLQDEEIVIVDGGSIDGTKEYLNELLNQKKIHQFISEKDFGEAHGTNKAILLAKGILLKIITDDDIFDFRVINFCKEHLLKNNGIDICGSDGFGISSLNNKLLLSNYYKGYNEWKINKTPFLFCGLSYIIRKSSISKMGLLSTQFKIIDFEYSVRVSSLHINIAFCNAYSFVNIVGEDSNSNKFSENIKSEKKKLTQIYGQISNLNYQISYGILIKSKLKKIMPSKTKKTSYQISYEELVNKSIIELNKKNNSLILSFL